MLKLIMRTALVVGLLALPAAPALAQGGGGAGRPMVREGGGRSGPVRALLDHRQDLKLTADQVSRLERIQAELDESTAAIREQLRALRESSGGDREAMREKARPLMERMRESSREAMGKAQSVLSAEQRELAKPYLPEGPGRRPGRRGGGSAGG